MLGVCDGTVRISFGPAGLQPESFGKVFYRIDQLTQGVARVPAIEIGVGISGLKSHGNVVIDYCFTVLAVQRKGIGAVMIELVRFGCDRKRHGEMPDGGGEVAPFSLSNSPFIGVQRFLSRRKVSLPKSFDQTSQPARNRNCHG